MTDEPPSIRFPADALVVLAGPSGAGKSTWANRWFDANQVVSTDAARGVVGEHEHDLRASSDAFALVDTILERRLKRGLFTVVDSLGMDADQNGRWRAMAEAHDRPTHIVLFDIDDKTCRKQNRGRPGEVPSKVLTAQLEKWSATLPTLGVGFDQVHHLGADPSGPASIVPRALLERGSGPSAALSFGLSISRFDFGDTGDIGERLGQIAAEAETAEFSSIWVMDHFMQIPQVGREWDPMLESMTTLGFLAARTSRVSIGALVACVTHRNLGHLGKCVATLDVLSGGRARCGLGIGWFEREHLAYGYRFPPVAERYQHLVDALEFLPVLWGPGSPAYEGRHFSTPEALCYPRPIQERIPILIGGSGEQRTLRLVAEQADACNLFGEPDQIRSKVEVLHRHCEEVGRDPAEIKITQLSTIISAADQSELYRRVADMKRGNESTTGFLERTTAGTHEQHVDRFARLAEAGVHTVIVSLADIGRPGAAADFAPIIEEF